MKFVWVSVLAVSSFAEEVNVALQSKVVVQGVMLPEGEIEPINDGIVLQPMMSETAKKAEAISSPFEADLFF